MIKALNEIGFVVDRQKGSHIILVKDERVVPVPRHEQIKRGLLLEIIAEAGMTKAVSQALRVDLRKLREIL